MRPFDRRPTDAEKSRWLGLEQTKKAKKDIDDLLANGVKKPEELVATDFTSTWSEHAWKEALISSQDGLCFWCTVKPKGGNSSGQVDHIRPKTNVYRNVVITKPPNGKVERKKAPAGGLRPGYHWLAYEPDNLVFTCQKCNNNKTSLWPVDLWEDPANWKSPQENVPETDLVLDPRESDFDPLKHFQFDKNGVMYEVPGDDRARATIVLVGLDEPPYTEAREEILRELKTDVANIFRKGKPDDVDIENMQRVAKRCEWSSPHAAFCRVALRKLLQDRQWSWGDFVGLLNSYGISLAIPEPPSESWRE